VLWFECDVAYADMLSAESCDAFLVAILPTAMRNGWDIFVDGTLSTQLFYNVSNYFMSLYSSVIADLRPVAIHPERLAPSARTASGVFTGFSAGIDSFCTILEHCGGNAPEGYAVTHLLFNNVGSHGEGGQSIFYKRLARLSPVASNLRLPLIAVDSNMDAILDVGFQQSHTVRNAAVALLFGKGCGKYLYSSACHYRAAHGGKSYDMCYSDALSVALLSSEATQFISAGGQHTRFEKTDIVSREMVTFGSLDVCVQPEVTDKINCSRCWKCLRTSLTLSVLGKLELYSEVLSPEDFREMEWLYLCLVIQSRDPLLLELKTEILARGFKMPLSVLVAAAVVPGVLIKVVLEEWGLVPRGRRLALAKRLILRSIRYLNGGRKRPPSPPASTRVVDLAPT
jgi:hypothetical protein